MLFRSFLWILLALFLAYALYRVGVLLMKKYGSSTSGSKPADSFQAKPIVSTPAPTLITERVNAQEPRGPVAPGGPNPPNQEAPPQIPVERLPEERANDTMDQMNSEVPIKDNLRHPELSFGPGVEPNGPRPGTGASSATVAAPLSTFSPDYAQNGGSFMGSVFANDLQPGDDFATA
jgi:hypothetical protein